MYEFDWIVGLCWRMKIILAGGREKSGVHKGDELHFGWEQKEN